LVGCGLLFSSGLLIINNQLTIGDYVSFAGYSTKILINIQSFMNLGILLSPVFVSIERIIDFFGFPKEDENTDIIIETPIMSINITNLGFKYDEYVFKNLFLSLNSGDKILLFGTNGVGKSTLMRLILGLYTPQEGGIYFNN
ncbi:ATP-binding cassette domain-containing protein, partial [Clostridium perfringens]